MEKTEPQETPEAHSAAPENDEGTTDLIGVVTVGGMRADIFSVAVKGAPRKQVLITVSSRITFAANIDALLVLRELCDQTIKTFGVEVFAPQAPTENK